MTIPQIVIELFPNSLCREYHVPVPIASEHVFGGGFLGGDRDDPFLLTFSDITHEEREPSEKTRATVMEFYAIPGIYAVSIKPSHVGIEREEDANWDQIEGAVVDVIKKELGWVDEVVTVRYRFDDITCDREWIGVLQDIIASRRT